jgi:hypothetical protein
MKLADLTVSENRYVHKYIVLGVFNYLIYKTYRVIYLCI